LANLGGSNLIVAVIGSPVIFHSQTAPPSANHNQATNTTIGRLNGSGPTIINNNGNITINPDNHILTVTASNQPPPNQKPTLTTLSYELLDKLSLEVDTTVNWMAVVASNPENAPLVYKFFLMGPATGNKISEKTG
jgi:hypothetical protein